MIDTVRQCVKPQFCDNSIPYFSAGMNPGYSTSDTLVLFSFWLLYFGFSLPLMCLEKQQKMAEVLELLTSIWQTRMEFLAIGFALVQTWVQQPFVGKVGVSIIRWKICFYVSSTLYFNLYFK